MRVVPVSTVDYLERLPEDRREIMGALCSVFRQRLPEGFVETDAYGMVSFCVPHSLYPAGYHCDPKIPLPFVMLASQKKHLAVYHMGLYAMPDLMAWFQDSWAKAGVGKLDLGKSCLRLNPTKPLPMEVLGSLAARVTVDRWIEAYGTMRPKGK